MTSRKIHKPGDCPAIHSKERQDDELSTEVEKLFSRAETLSELAALSQDQERDDLRLDLFPKGEAKPAEVIACASFFFNGGTVFRPHAASPRTSRSADQR